MTPAAQWLLRRKLWFIAAASLLVVYTLVGFFLAPRLARNAIEAFVQQELHCKIAIGDLTFNPFTLTARITNFAMTEADDTAIASFDALVVNVELASVIYVGAVFKEISIDNPHGLIRVNRDGSLNLAKLAPPSDANTPPAHDDDELPVVRIGVFALRGGRLTVEDQSRPRPFTAMLAPIEFSLNNFRTEPKFGNAYRFVASTADGERLEWFGEFSVQPLGSHGQFSLANIKATTIASYLQDALPFQLPSGALDLQGSYRVAFTDRIDFRVELPTIKARDVGMALRGDPAGAPWITIPDLSITGTSLSLAERSVSIEDIGVGDATLTTWLEKDGGVNLSRLFSADSPAPTGPTPTDSTAKPSPAPGSSAEWRVGVKTLHIDRAHVGFEDRSIQPAAKFTLSPVDIVLGNYSSDPKSALAVDVRVGVGNGLVTANGPVILEPLGAKLNIAVKEFELPTLQPYAVQSTDLKIHRGRLSLQSQLEYAAQPAKGQPVLKLTGDIEVADLLTKDNALEEDFIKWQSLKVSGLTYQQSPDRLSIVKVHARKPYGRVIIASDGTFNIAQVLNPQRAADKASSAPTGAPGGNSAEQKSAMPARIRSVVVEDGSASFADYSVTPSFATEIAELKGSVEGLTSEPNSRAKVQLTGSVDRYAPVSIDGEVNLLSRDTFTDISMNFRNIELTTFNPYSGKFAGYNITKGKLSTEMKYKVENRQLDARHHIVVDQLEFGEATGSKDAVSLPIKLAVALLKDRHGVIDLDLPISGNIDDPKFRLGPIIWQVLKNTLEKIVTAPFTLLGKLFGGGDDLAYVEFSHGSAALDPAVTDKLGKLKQAMIERPQLKLDVPMRVVDDADSAALSKQAFENALAPALSANPDRQKALAALYTKEFGKAPVYPAPTITDPTKDADKTAAEKAAETAESRINLLEGALQAKFAATPSQVEELGRKRGAAVRDALLTGGEIPPERVFLSTRALEESPRDQEVRMELKLE